MSGVLVVDSCSIVSDTDTGWKVFAGFEANRYFALEATYVDLGTLKLSGSSTVPTPVAISSNIHASAIGIDGVVSIPISKEFYLSARAGLSYWSINATTTRESLGSTVSVTPKKPTGHSLDFGVGAGYDFTQNVGLRVEFQRFKDIGDEGTTGKSDIDLMSASLVYRFR